MACMPDDMLIYEHDYNTPDFNIQLKKHFYFDLFSRFLKGGITWLYFGTIGRS